MGLKYRWMQKNDFNKINSNSKLKLKKSLKNKKIIANIVEYKNNILGWIFYELNKSKEVKITNIAFSNKEVFNFILENLYNKNKNIEICISEYDLKMQLILKESNFLFIESIKNKDAYYYKFRKEIGPQEPSQL